MKYKRLHRISKAKSAKFFHYFQSLIQEHGEELVWKTLREDAKTDFLGIKKRFEMRKFGLHLIHDIDALLKKHKLTLNMVFSLFYGPHIENLVYSSNPLLNLIPKLDAYNISKPIKIPFSYS